MTDYPLISIIMGVYNEEEYLSESIESILSQTYENLEFIIVDDASDDGSIEIIESFDDPRIVELKNDENRGLTQSLNRALERANGEFIARQDADDISRSDRLERQVQFLQRYDDVAVVGTGAYLIDGEGTTIDKRVPKCNPTFEDFMDKGHLIHGSIMARRSILEHVNGYNDFFRYGQDQELWLRLAKDYPIANIPDPLYRHRIHDEGVYFSRKDESAMYGKLARDLVTGRAESDVLENLERDSVLSYYDRLSPERRAAFHRDLATRYLRYGHTEPALEECRKAREYEPYAFQNLVLSILARLGPSATDTVRWAMRRYLNAKTRIGNRVVCPYEFD